MYKILYSIYSLEWMRSYIGRIELSQSQRFHDSGLWCEDIIIDNYQKSGKKLLISFRDHIEKRLAGDTVLGYRPDPENPGHATLIMTIEDHTLIIDYFEEKEQKTRIVENIRIFRG